MKRKGKGIMFYVSKCLHSIAWKKKFFFWTRFFDAKLMAFIREVGGTLNISS